MDELASTRMLRFFVRGIIIVSLLFLVTPSLIVIISAFSADSSMSFPPSGFSLRWFIKALSYPDFQTGFINSFVIMGITAIISVYLGTTAAYAIERFSFPGKKTLEAVLLSPLIIPNFTVGLAFLMFATSIFISRTMTLVVITHTIIVMPFVLRNVYVSLKNLDPNLGLAAQSLGASPVHVFFRIDLPLLMPGIFGGVLFSTILSFNEVSASLFVTSQSTQTLPVAMFTYISDYPDPSMAAISAMLIGAVTFILFISEKYLGLRKMFMMDAKYDPGK